MRIVAFDPTYNEKLSTITRALASGIPGCEVVPMGEYVPCDIAIIFGAWKKAYKPTYPKWEIMKKHEGRRLLMIESGFWGRGELYQVGWGGFAGGADFNLQRFGPGKIPADRWQNIGPPVIPWRHNKDGAYIVMGQVPHDTQVQDTDHRAWCRGTVEALAARGEKVYFRPHPRVKTCEAYGVPDHYHLKGKLHKAMKIAKAVVTWNSTSAVDAIMQGVPAIAQHPSSIAYNVASHDLQDPLRYPDLSQWLRGMAYSLWTVDEMAAGLPWEHLNK